MMENVLIITIFILALSAVAISLENLRIQHDGDELIGVAVCFRHGDKAPTHSYPNDPYLDSKYWPSGFGELLDKGKVNHFNTGKWLRSRYKGFLSERYSPYEILVRSTDVDRTLMSASSNLAGLYYPNTSSQSNIWPESLPWNPVPIHTVPAKDDEILSMERDCERFKDIYQATLHSEYFKDVLKKHESIKKIVESKTGWNITDITVFQGLYTVFYVYKSHNISYLPNWAYDLDQDELSFLAGLSFSVETFYPSLQRLKVGPFFNYLNSYFDGVINGTNPMFLMLSAHDGTIASILNSYGSYDYHPPEFCSMVIWELYKTSTGDVYLKIFYRRNSEAESVEAVKVGNCASSCSYSDYRQYIRDITVDSDTWERECNNVTNKKWA